MTSGVHRARAAHVRAVLFLALAAVNHVQVVRADLVSTQPGNGNTGFGGPVGNGTLAIDSIPAGTLTFTFTRGGGSLNDALVLYVDSASGGASSTAGFSDQADGLRRAISGQSSSGTSVLTFPVGFTADYAIALNSGFAGLWSLANPTNFAFVASANLSPSGTASAPSYTFSIDGAQLGLAANSGQSFSYLGSYLSESAFRSNEAFGYAVAGGNPGWASQAAATSVSVTTVPEPAIATVCGCGLTVVLWRALRRRSL